MDGCEIEVRTIAEAYNIGFEDGFGSAKLGVLCKHVPNERTCEFVSYDDGEGYPPNIKCSGCGVWIDAIIDNVYDCASFKYCPNCGAKVER